MSNKIKTYPTDLICLNCGNITTIQRRRSQVKEVSHIKDLYCYKCKDVTKHYELIEKDRYKMNLDKSKLKSEIEKIVIDYLTPGKVKKK